MMGKRMLGTVLSVLLLSGCGKTALDIPVVEPGWDIYTGGVYRYGPSIVVNKDGSIDAWFAAPGGYHDAKNLKYLSLGDSGNIRVGENVYAIGNPIGYEFRRTVTSGIISAKNRTIKLEEENKSSYMTDLIQTDATINPRK